MTIHKKSKRILVIKSRAIGDTVLLTGCLRELKKAKPDYEIHVLVRSPAGELLEHLPFIDRVISTLEPKGKIERLAYWMRLVKRLREKRYEMVLNFHASFRSSLTAKFLRSNLVVANHHELGDRKNWFSDLPIPGRGVVKPIIERDLDLLRAIGIDSRTENALPEIQLTSTEIHWAKQTLEKGFKNKNPIIYLGIGASRQTKRWPIRQTADLITKLLDQKKYNLVMISTAEDEHFLSSLFELLPQNASHSENLLHLKNISLRKVAQIVSQCKLYVGNDSGVKHIAAAQNVKTITLFGPEAPLEWHPYNTDQHPYFFIQELDCRTESGKHWCSISVCDKYKNQCLSKISSQDVFNKIEELCP